MTSSPLLLLDTHVWVWVMEGDIGRISEYAQQAIDDASGRGALRISAISLWEVAMLEAKGRLLLTKGCQAWLEEAIVTPGMRLMPIEADIAVESTRLPGDFHGDPADRLLVASARVNGMTLITCDQKILTYGKEGFVSVIQGCR